jgi:hypothetical protein
MRILNKLQTALNLNPTKYVLILDFTDKKRKDLCFGMEHKFYQFYDQQGLLRILTEKCTIKMTSFTPTTTITMTRPPTTTVTQTYWT